VKGKKLPDTLEVIYISKPLTSGKALDFWSKNNKPLAIETEYSNGKRRTKYYRFVVIVPKDKIVLQRTVQVKKEKVKQVYSQQ
jgi:hypothetical protein